MHWTTGFFSNLPSVLAKEAVPGIAAIGTRAEQKQCIHQHQALQDEWKKAVGRIPPEMSNVCLEKKGFGDRGPNPCISPESG